MMHAGRRPDLELEMKVGVKSDTGKAPTKRYLPVIKNTSGATGEAVKQNADTYFGTSLAWAGGGECSPLTQGSYDYKPVGCEGGMS
jgi:hypothetical protein